MINNDPYSRIRLAKRRVGDSILKQNTPLFLDIFVPLSSHGIIFPHEKEVYNEIEIL